MSVSTDTILQLVQSHGLVLLFLLSIVEGPIVTVIGGWLAKAGLLPFWWVYVVCVLADLVGDLILYYVDSLLRRPKRRPFPAYALAGPDRAGRAACRKACRAFRREGRAHAGAD